MRESSIKKHLLKELTEIGVDCRKVKWENRRNAPDWLIFAMGGIWYELKKPGEKPTEAQRLEHERMRAAGMRVEVIDSMEMVDALVNQIKWFLKK